MRFFFHQYAILIVIGGLALAASSIVAAQTASEIQGKISSTNEQLQKLNQEIPLIEKDLNTLGTKKKTLNTSIVELDLTRKKLQTEIKITQINVDTTSQKITQLGSQISEKEKEIDSRLAAIKEAVRLISERDARALPEVALSNESFSGFWDDIEAISQFNTSVADNVEKLKLLKGDLQNKTQQKQIEKKNYLGLKSTLTDQKTIAENAKKEKAQLLVQTKNQESAFSKLLKQKLALKDALEQELRNYEQTLKFILDPTSIPARGKKVFSPPLAKLIITQQFGKTSSSGRLYASGTHNGTDFKASIGTPVMAVLDGTVLGTGDTDVTCPGASYGRWVLIKHSNGLASLYAHFSLIKVSRGDVVNTGEIIGYSGNTGYSTGPHLHLTVFAAAAVKVENRPSKACGGRTYTMPLAAINAYLDPMDYL
jgi:murein DD-endopeptidase MepM/ murein hydrolase activator NlpD